MIKSTFNVLFCIFLSVVCFTLSFKNHVYAELLSHFAVIYFFINTLFLSIFIYYKSKAFIVLSLVTCILTVYPLMRSFERTSNHIKIGQSHEDISILQCNIHDRNKNPEFILDRIQSENFPDIILIQEATPEMEEIFKRIRVWYPYTVEAPQIGAYGMVLFSKIPIIKAQRKKFDKTPNKYTVIEFITPQKKIPFAVIELHATSPAMDPQMDRKQELEELPTIMTQTTANHKILVGDLNTTPYSPYFWELKDALNFKNAAGGLQLEGTWPTYFPFFLRIPIDHFLISKTMDVLERSICEDVGSDHLPILTHIRLYNSAK